MLGRMSKNNWSKTRRLARHRLLETYMTWMREAMQRVEASYLVVKGVRDRESDMTLLFFWCLLR
jgi:predicted trehalose synthase